MGISRDELRAFMEAQRADYAAQLPGKFDVLQALWQARQLKEFERAAHSIYGAAGTYGFREVGAHAGTLEEIAQGALSQGGAPTAEQAARIEETLAALRLSLPAPP